MKVVIANVRPAIAQTSDAPEFWARHPRPDPRGRLSLFDQPAAWGLHMFAIGLYLRDRGLADAVEFWEYQERRRMRYMASGILRVTFHDAEDVAAYVDRHGAPDLFINYGRDGILLLELLADRCFRVHVPCLRGDDQAGNAGAECYLVDDPAYLDDRSMLYIPVVNVEKIRPNGAATLRDFIYLAAAYAGKRHDLVVDAVRGTELTGHFHPVRAGTLDLTGTRVTTSDWNERDLVELLTTSRIAVYPSDGTSNPAALWECVAAGLPIVVNARIPGGRHVVVPGVTGELAEPEDFRAVMRRVLADRARYRAREHLMTHWEPRAMLARYVDFFRRMGWRPSSRRSAIIRAHCEPPTLGIGPDEPA